MVRGIIYKCTVPGTRVLVRARVFEYFIYLRAYERYEVLVLVLVTSCQARPGTVATHVLTRIP